MYNIIMIIYNYDKFKKFYTCILKGYLFVSTTLCEYLRQSKANKGSMDADNALEKLTNIGAVLEPVTTYM